MTDRIELNEFDGDIHVIGYTHADIAWVHTREWHIDRYVRALDEILDMMDEFPDYKYYIDTWTELMIPYVKLRPQNLDRIRKFIRNGQLAVCGGHYGNVRSTNVGDETFVRNLQRGMKHWREFEPSVKFNVYADMDVTLGHTQMPQLLLQAGLMGYFVQRPLEALDSENVPRAFYWKGLSGDEVLVIRQLYGGLFMMSERHGPTWDTDWNAVVDGLWKGYLERPIQDGIDNVALCVGSDDTRPDRFLLGNDEKCHYRNLMELWNERQPSKMKYSTPDALFASVASQRDKLKTIDKILDPTDVSYNTANHGRRGVWWNREKSDRLIVQSEIINTFAAIQTGAEYPEEEIIADWEKLLDWTPHAVQYLFRQDWQAAKLALMKTEDNAFLKIKRGVKLLSNGTLPMDSDGIVTINTLPYKRKELVPIWVVNGDLTRDLARIKDKDGKEIEFQVVDYPVCNAEISLLAEMEIPSGGYTSFKYEWDPVPSKQEGESDITNAEIAPYWRTKYNIFDAQKIEDDTFELSSNRLKIKLEKGLIVSVEDLQTGAARIAPERSSFLEPVCYAVKKEGWFTEGIDDEPSRFSVESVRWDHNGPLLWRITRTGNVSGYWVRQNIDLYKDEAEVRSTLHFMAPSGNAGTFIAISIPISEDAEIDVDIPFGIEARNIDEIKYGAAERAIPGFFWARTWANAKDSIGQTALLAEDGDKFFRAYGNPRKLVHIMAQKTKMFEQSWEGYIDTYDTGGRQDFRHRMILSDVDASVCKIVKTAEAIRHPVRYEYAPAEMMDKSAELININPSSISMNAFYMEKDCYIMRLTQMSDESAKAEIKLPFIPSKVQLVNLNGDEIKEKAAIKDNIITFDIRPWQISTINIIK